MPKIRLLRLDGLRGGDAYELAYAHSYPARHWPPDSLYLPDSSDGMALLAPCLDAVFPRFAYCGPQKVTRAQWEQAEALCPDREFCRAVRRWLEAATGGAGFFGMRGI